MHKGRQLGRRLKGVELEIMMFGKDLDVRIGNDPFLIIGSWIKFFRSLERLGIGVKRDPLISVCFAT